MNYTKEQIEFIERLKKECEDDEKKDVRKELGYKNRTSEPCKKELAKKYLPGIIDVIRGTQIKSAMGEIKIEKEEPVK